MERYTNARYGISLPEQKVIITCDYCQKELNIFFAKEGKVFCNIVCSREYGKVVR